MSESIVDDIYKQGFHIRDNFLDETTFQKLREAAELKHSEGLFRQAKIGSESNAKHHFAIRNDKICWLDENKADDAVSTYFSKIRALAQMLNQSLFLGLVDFESHFAIFQPGSFYKKHVDQFSNTQDRRISCVYYLNAEWQESFAGQLKLYNCYNQLLAEVLPQANRFICFRSELLHEVCQTQSIRYSIAGWMKTRALSFK